MATQSILITAMANGLSDQGHLRISLLVSPRLDAESDPQQLATFSDFVDWPSTLNNSQLILRLGSNTLDIDLSQTNSNYQIDYSVAAPDGSLWQAMLPASTWVKGFSFSDMSNKSILSYSTTKMADRQKSLYQQLANKAADQLPEIKFLQVHAQWKALITDVEALDRAYAETPDRLPRNINQQFSDFIKGELAANTSPAQQELALFQLFHTPAAPPQLQDYSEYDVEPAKLKAKWQTFLQTPLPSSEQLVSQLDFHQIVAAMNQYPVLLRKLGLVIDLLIDKSGLSLTNDDELSAQINLPTSTNTAVTREATVSPRVHCQASRGGFFTLSNPQQVVKINQGLLDINAEHFAIIQHDVDSSGIKTMNTARTLARQSSDKVRKDPTSRQERRSGVPALRNAGLMLVQLQRSQRLAQRFNQNLQFNNKILQAQQGPATQLYNASPELYAEDVNRGLRFDIWDSVSKKWHSLCRRNGQYAIEGYGQFSTNDEEGIVRLAATQSPNRNYLPELIYLHEMLLSWTGWSLCAPAPGNIVNNADEPDVQEAEVPAGIPLKTTYSALPGSLPRLRYGRDYWVRARAVDLAGNSLISSERDISSENPQNYAQTYWRFDPIKPPVIALYKANANTLDEPQEGESMQRIAIRTYNDVPALNIIDSGDVAQRFALADSASVKDAELHGMLDSNNMVNPASFNLLATKDAPLQETLITSIPPAVPSPDDPPLGETRFAVFEQGNTLPYLPDPLCVELAARLFNHPDFPENQIIPIRLYSTGKQWPDALPFKIRLEEITGQQPEFTEEDNVLHIPLPKACRVILRLSVKPQLETLQLMGIWNWLTAAEQTKLEALALSGQHWMLTPWREIELVHAVQKPLITPDPSIQIIKQKAQTWVVPRFTTELSIKSTESVDLMARWHEPEISSTQEPGDIAKTERAFAVKITAKDDYAGKPEHQIVKPDLIRAGSKGDAKLVDKVHEFSDTRYRRVEYWLEATTRFREYMPASVLTETVNNKKKLTDKNIKVVGPAKVQWIPNSSPPPAPKVLYVVPTFHWIRSQTDSKKQSTRRGGGLRVYLDKPWQASGYGEMLAVVLPGDKMTGLDPNDNPQTQPVKNFVSQWGNDPAWLTPFISGPAPTLSNFPKARIKPDPQGTWLPSTAEPSEADQAPGNFLLKGLSHPQITDVVLPLGGDENNKKRVNIAPHDVFYDEQRQLWYCDIELSPKTSYYPFVRLALARYQPTSLANCHLSNIVLADFMTLANDRYATVTKVANQQQRRVEVFGTSYSRSSGYDEAPTLTSPLPNGQTKIPDIAAKTVVEVWVEKLLPALGEDFGWQKDSQADVVDQTDQPVRRIVMTARAKARILRDKTKARALLKQQNYAELQQQNLLEMALVLPTLWKGYVVLPAQDDIQRRIVVAEYEEYLADDETPYDGFVTKKGRRLVFVEHIVLD